MTCRSACDEISLVFRIRRKSDGISADSGERKIDGNQAPGNPDVEAPEA